MDIRFLDFPARPVRSWEIFSIVIGMLVFGLGILHRKSNADGVTKSLPLTAMMHRVTHLEATLWLGVTATLVPGGDARSHWQTLGHVEPAPIHPALEYLK